MINRRSISKLMAVVLCIAMIMTMIPVIASAALSVPQLTGATAADAGIKITWNSVSGATGYRVFRKGDGSGWTALGNTSGTSYKDNTAKEKVTYTYTVRAMGPDGMSDYDPVGVSCAWTKSTAGYLALPKLVSAKAESSGIRVKWEKNSNADGYRIYRKEGSGSWKTLKDVGAVAEYLDTNCKSGTKYTYTVRCLKGGAVKSDYDHNGVSATWNSGIAPGNIAAPKLISAVAEGEGLRVKWNSVSGASAYRIYRKSGGGSWQHLVDVSSTSYLDNATNAGTNYSYTVRCLNNKGNLISSYDKTGVSGSWSKGSTGNLPNPVLSGVKNKTNGVLFTWNAVSGASGYRVYRKTGSGGWKTLGDTTSTSYLDKTASSNNKYTYTARAKNAAGQIDSGYDATGKSIVFYAAPTMVSAKSVEDGIKVTWKAVTGASRYLLYRDAGSGFKQIAKTTGTSYTDKTFPAGVVCTYTVKVIDSDGKQLSDYDHTGVSTTYVGKVALTSIANDVGGVLLKWNSMTGAAKYRLFRKTDDGAWVTLKTVTGTSYLDTNAVNGTKHAYYIRALDSAGDYVGTYDSAGKSIVYYATPTLIDCVRLSNALEISWEAVEYAVNYEVFRKIGSGNWISIAVTSGTAYLDTSMPSGTWCLYTVKTIGSSGESSYDHTGKGATSYMEKPVLVSAENDAGFVVVTWNPVDKASMYQVYRKTGEYTSYKPVAIVSGTVYDDADVVSGTRYTYTVATSNGTEDMSEYDETGISITYYKVPVLNKAENAVGGVKLTWNLVDGISSYRIYRKTGNSDWTVIGSVSGNTASYTDTNVVANGHYWYTVSCLKGTTEVSAYDAVGVSTQYYPAPTMKSATVNDGSVAVAWNPVDGIGTYRLYRKTNSGKYAVITDVTGYSYTDTKVASGNKYTYTVRCMKSGKVASEYDSTVSATYLSAPTITVKSTETGKATISWTAVTGATSYKVQRKTATSSWSTLGTTTGTSYTAKDMTSGGVYTFRVIAEKSGTSSAAGAGVSCTIK